MELQQVVANSVVQQHGDNLIICLSRPIAESAGFYFGLSVQIMASPGQLVIEPSQKERSLEEMLAQFDPQKHGGEEMIFTLVGKELLS